METLYGFGTDSLPEDPRGQFDNYWLVEVTIMIIFYMSLNFIASRASKKKTLARQAPKHMETLYGFGTGRLLENPRGHLITTGSSKLPS